MNTDQLRQRFPDELACRTFLETMIWGNNRICPHCQSQISYKLSGASSKPGYMSGANVNGNLLLQPRHRCIAPNCLGIVELDEKYL